LLPHKKFKKNFKKKFKYKFRIDRRPYLTKIFFKGFKKTKK